MERFWDDVRATTTIELVAVVTGIVYVILILRRDRRGWVAGAVSSLIYVWLAATARLPMQSVLQAYYVVMAAYGWWSWTRNRDQEGGRIHSWSWMRHAVALLVVVIASVASARLLASETRAAWPLLDSFTTMISLLATWMVARSVLQNWLYWIVADAVMTFLFLQQGHPFTALLFMFYLIVAALGFRKWRQLYHAQTAAA
jgi:nicotinamide mononucleotide transporter